MVRQLCQQHTALSATAIAHLEAVAQQLPLIAALHDSDVFIDCFTSDGEALVVAHQPPPQGKSAYTAQVVGQEALAEKEPAVYRAAQTVSPVRDIKALTQEGQVVRQDVAPIVVPGEGCVGVLIREKDISLALQQARKLEALSKAHQAEDTTLRGDTATQEGVLLREMHHRVKNSLQLIASILNLQARRCDDEKSRKILQENVGRVLSIAAIHDILNQTVENQTTIDSLVLLEKLRKNLQSLVADHNSVSLTVTGDGVPLQMDIASSVALVVNELITNALSHAFVGREKGRITIQFSTGALFDTVTVTDDGIGFDPLAQHKGLGLRLVSATVQDKLQGRLRLSASDQGSKISFDFKSEYRPQ